MLKTNIPLASSIQSGQGRSGWRRVKRRLRGSPGPRTGPPSGDTPAWAARTTFHPTECSPPGGGRSSCRTEWTAEAFSSSFGDNLGEQRRKRCEASCTWQSEVKSVSWVGLVGGNNPSQTETGLSSRQRTTPSQSFSLGLACRRIHPCWQDDRNIKGPKN